MMIRDLNAAAESNFLLFFLSKSLQQQLKKLPSSQLGNPLKAFVFMGSWRERRRYVLYIELRRSKCRPPVFNFNFKPTRSKVVSRDTQRTLRGLPHGRYYKEPFKFVFETHHFLDYPSFLF